MNNYKNQTPPPVTRHHHLNSAHLPPPAPSSLLHHAQQQQHQVLVHQQQQQQSQHHHHNTHHTPPPPLPPPNQQQQQHQPLISNSLAIRQEIQRFESVHPSIYAIYDLIDLLPITDAQMLCQQIRDHVVCIEDITPEQFGLILNSQAKKKVKNAIAQLPCGWPAYGIPPLAPYTNADLELSMKQAVLEELANMFKFRFDGLDEMQIKKLDISYTFGKKVKFHFIFPELRATAFTLKTDTLIDTLQQLGISVRYEGSGPMEFALENLSIKGQFKYKMPIFIGSIKIYKFEAVINLGSVRSELGGILGNGRFNQFINEKIEYMIPAFINGKQEEISAQIESNFVPRVNAFMKGKKLWDLLGMLGGSNNVCNPAPAPWF